MEKAKHTHFIILESYYFSCNGAYEIMQENEPTTVCHSREECEQFIGERLSVPSETVPSYWVESLDGYRKETKYEDEDTGAECCDTLVFRIREV